MKQEWFWTQANTIIPVVIGSLLIIISNYLIEKSKRSTQVKLEKIKIYDEKKFHAYIELYGFISIAYSYYWPPDKNTRRNFITLMKEHFYIKVKINYPYFKKDIREKIRILENQYECLGEPDFVPQIPFDRFFKDDYLEILNELNSTVEKVFDEWERN